MAQLADTPWHDEQCVPFIETERIAHRMSENRRLTHFELVAHVPSVENEQGGYAGRGVTST